MNIFCLQAGLIGFRTDKTEEISGYDCAVYSTSGKLLLNSCFSDGKIMEISTCVVSKLVKS